MKSTPRKGEGIPRIAPELLETFCSIVECDGDAGAAAGILDINQPAVSKRLATLRRLTSKKSGAAGWLELKGKRWHLTAEGQRVFGVVSNLVRQYQQAERFIAHGGSASAQVSVACGQLASHGLVASATDRYLRKRPDVRLCLSTVRGRARIAGVAGGQFDMAIVSDSASSIREIAGCELHLAKLGYDEMVLVANPNRKASWANKWIELPRKRGLKPGDLVELPLILPESDAERRQQFESWFVAQTGQPPSIAVETGGWIPILNLARLGHGVGLATSRALAYYELLFGAGKAKPLTSSTRKLDQERLDDQEVHLLTKKVHGQYEPDLSDEAAELHRMIVEANLVSTTSHLQKRR